jgi:hypothetical protein
MAKKRYTFDRVAKKLSSKKLLTDEEWEFLLSKMEYNSSKRMWIGKKNSKSQKKVVH